MEINQESHKVKCKPSSGSDNQRVKSRSPTRRIYEWSPNPFSPLDQVVDLGEEDTNYPEYPSITTEPATSSPLNPKKAAPKPVI